jgi:hypothetical protein
MHNYYILWEKINKYNHAFESNCNMQLKVNQQIFSWNPAQIGVLQMPCMVHVEVAVHLGYGT